MTEQERSRAEEAGPPEERKPGLNEPEEAQKSDAPPRDEVEEASEESFPASDPPSWSPGEAA